MRIEGVNQPPKVAQTNQRSVVDKGKKPVDGGDVLEISKDAQEVSELAAKARAAAERVSPRLEEIRARIKDGFYNTPEARERIAEGLLQSGSIKESIGDLETARAAKKKLEETKEVREDKMDQARQRVASQFYDTATVRQETADRLLDEAI